MLIFAFTFHLYIVVIKKGGGIRPCDALATLYANKEGATFYQFALGR